MAPDRANAGQGLRRADRQGSGPSAGSGRIRALNGPNSDSTANHVNLMQTISKPYPNHIQTVSKLILFKPNLIQTKCSHDSPCPSKAVHLCSYFLQTHRSCFLLPLYRQKDRGCRDQCNPSLVLGLISAAAVLAVVASAERILMLLNVCGDCLCVFEVQLKRERPFRSLDIPHPLLWARPCRLYCPGPARCCAGLPILSQTRIPS